MTTGAQAPQIALIVRAAIGDGLHMMHQGCHRRSPQSKALLAKWMHRYISVTDFSPRISIPLMLIVATGKMLVMPLHQAPMFLAVARPAVGQIRTATVSAGAFGFRWHGIHLGKQKSPRGFMPSKARFRFYFHDTILSRQHRNDSEFYCTLSFFSRILSTAARALEWRM